mmetsp:Transcript_93726/g.166765  ORF Transcript_93726/g.166765 Transcript_93726/m.166765 type:complete len:160 (-) Transcript_93726:142-621(-)|eukprot:CAMPEP_0197620578 /NCGR_PEP_ID=MMETSP1338-20131121/1385_1 /TAXON_ID=43686 ORGANISM="Pelagodinium beii, Strain RCC1491" /NCGR_SAMPLE_ID=MMETSP1338 /ASSEMBLY_ACC=CAM_ASM_000754 /LENGTH=159 /DNA_ID=CAMNT_0043189813 /DNA_START=70 /DNA_END=549 /DNA_ORIENTATION=+
MSFSRADRDQHHLTGSDDASAPDYVKGPPPRSQRDSARAAREARAASGKQPLPKVPLRMEKPRYRTGTMAKELFTADGAFVMGSDSRSKTADHPLVKFERQAPLKPTGRFRGDDGELAKITSIPYKQEESLLERRLAYKGSKATQDANRGGYNIFSGSD